MKIKPLLGMMLCAALFCFIACTTTPKTIAFQTLSGVETSTTASYDAFIALVIAGKAPTNDVPKVSRIYNQFQDGLHLAVVAAQFNMTNAAPPEVVGMSQNVLTQISVAKGAK
jgi:hypothetical protein